ncbi:MAG: hypothetical protein KF832_06340 [Caldilineaceae bacterium]|nr:hypothetical protein [Caldilineaceae bacterium]
MEHSQRSGQGTVRLYQLPGSGCRAWLYLAAGIEGRGSYELPGRLGGYPLLIALDAQFYQETLQLTAQLDQLIASHQLPPLIALLLDRPHRQDLWGDVAFAEMVAAQVLPWLRAYFPVTRAAAQTIVAGAHAGGVAAASVGLHYPQLFGKILAQNGWFHRLPGPAPQFHGLTPQAEQASREPLRFYVAVDKGEAAQLTTANRLLRAQWLAAGHQVDYIEDDIFAYSNSDADESPLSPLGRALIQLVQEE